MASYKEIEAQRIERRQRNKRRPVIRHCACCGRPILIGYVRKQHQEETHEQSKKALTTRRETQKRKEKKPATRT
jgi:hypothetical protein